MGADSLPPPTIMPSSRYHVIPAVLDIVLALHPKSILDIGAGTGKYGALFREYLDVWDTATPYSQRNTRIDGVEINGDYVNPLWNVYDDFTVADIRDLESADYDLIFMGDVIEHFTKEEGLELVNRLNYQALLIVTPVEPLAQGAVYGNEHEAHRSKWDGSEFPGAQTMAVNGQLIILIQKENQ